ncbi:ABC transporter substrate-binding protein [Thermodesulfobacteriota bacterium]
MKIVWYTTIGVDDAKKLSNRFEEIYPFIKVETSRLGADKLLNRVLAEARAGRHSYDVNDNGVSEFEILISKGFIAKYLSPQMKFYPEDHRHPEGYWTGIYSNQIVVAYNTGLVSPREVPKTYKELLDPKWKGKMGMDTRSYYWFSIMMKIMGGEEKGLQYMKKLSEQNISFRRGRNLITILVSAGEMSIGIGLYNHAVEQLKEKGAPIEWFAIEPVIVKTHPTGISSHPPHPNAARLFLDFLLSREGQKVISSVYRIPTRTDVDAIAPGLKIEDKKTFPLDLSVAKDFERHVKLFRKVLMKK